MKLVIAICHDEDSHDLTRKLTENEYGVTKLASTGGFLKTGNTTLLIGAKKEEIDNVIDIIKETCQTRKEYTMSSAMVSDVNTFMTQPIEVSVGGATVFVLDVSDYYKL